jgi:hypothetical protein
MRKRIGSTLIALAFAFGIMAAVSSTAEAQWRTNDDSRYGRNNSYGNQQQLNQGYQYGINTGASDAQRGQNYGPQRSRYYRNAPSQAFREGFVRGYDQAYRQYANNGGYGNNGGYRNDGYYGNNGGYGNGGYGNGGYEQQELNRGYQQGINTGASDGRSRKSYSPQRSRYYQNASNQAYREGFVRGYDQGYRQYSNSGTYGNRNGNWGTILGQILGRP